MGMGVDFIGIDYVHQLLLRMHSELSVNVLHVGFYCMGRNHQLFLNVCRIPAARQVFYDIGFARGKLVVIRNFLNALVEQIFIVMQQGA